MSEKTKDLVEEQLRGRPLELYEVDDGATHWVVARCEAEAVIIAMRHVILSMDGDLDELSVRQLADEDNAGAIGIQDWEGEATTMWGAFLELQTKNETGYLACSEF